jgi:hypothetical protein
MAPTADGFLSSDPTKRCENRRLCAEASTVPDMALIYPVQADLPEPDDDSDPDFDELAADLSDQWLVEVAVSEDGEDGCFGPLPAREAWDLAVEIDDKRPEWAVSVVPLYAAEPADRLIELFDEADE